MDFEVCPAIQIGFRMRLCVSSPPFGSRESVNPSSLRVAGARYGRYSAPLRPNPRAAGITSKTTSPWREGYVQELELKPAGKNECLR
jgi:hypothetical protein